MVVGLGGSEGLGARGNLTNLASNPEFFKKISEFIMIMLAGGPVVPSAHVFYYYTKV